MMSGSGEELVVEWWCDGGEVVVRGCWGVFVCVLAGVGCGVKVVKRKKKEETKEERKRRTCTQQRSTSEE